jgi:predicted phage terminase large subunit-like protein
VWIDRQLDLIARWKPEAWFGEGGVIQKAIEPFLNRRAQERRTYAWFNWLPSIHDKPTRARAFQARAAMRMVHVPVGPEGDAWIDEMIRFPTGAHDDEVDCASLLGRALDEAHPATKAATQGKVNPRSDYGFNRDRSGGGNGWKTA